MGDIGDVVAKLSECVDKQDFAGAFALVRENRVELAKKLNLAGIRDTLKKATNDRLLLAFVDGVEFGKVPLDESLMRLEKLVSFTVDSLVLSKAWGLGTVRKLDYFYKRITVDFKTKKGHQFTFLAATDMLTSAPEGHILVLRKSDPAAFETLLKDKPGEFIKQVLKSYGDMPITRLEDVCTQNGFVKSVNWKEFWDKARAELRMDKGVKIPSHRADPICLNGAEEDYGEKWMTAFSHETDPKLILTDVREYVAKDKLKDADAATRAAIGERLEFAVTAARKTDDALYARLACLVVKLGFATPSATEMRAYLCDRKRYIKAAVALPAREVGEMIAFLAADEEIKAKLYKAIPELCFTAVTEIINQFGQDANCRKAIGEYMKQPKAPATLRTLIVGKYEQFKDWSELPPLITLLSHAIALGEGRQGGETLKMQNIIRRLFSDKKWLEKVFSWLEPADKALFFERFQASIAWDPSTHHTTVIRMTKIVPELEAHIVKVEKKKEYARLTSYRSFGLRKQEYLKLINEDMPANVKRIEFAKSYGDLSENAEYQYAKDEQRALMQKQSLMQADLEAVKPSDFADATTDEVMPGVTVVANTKDGEKIWTILGEWDNDIEKGILSSKTRVAQGMLGKKIGDNFEMPDENGNIAFATIKEIRPLSEELKEWMKLPVGIQI